MPGSLTVASSAVRPPVLPPAAGGSPAPATSPPLALADIRNGQVTLVLPIEDLIGPWQNVTAQMLTRGAITIRDRAARMPPVVLTGERWRQSLRDAASRLPEELPHLLASPYLCALYGLDALLPVTFRIALFEAARHALDSLGEQGRLSAAQAEQQLMRVNACLVLPMSRALQHGAFHALFDELYRAGRASPPELICVHNAVPH